MNCPRIPPLRLNRVVAFGWHACGDRSGVIRAESGAPPSGIATRRRTTRLQRVCWLGLFALACRSPANESVPNPGRLPARARVEAPAHGKGTHPVAMSSLELSPRGAAMSQGDLEHHLQGFRDSNGRMRDIQDLLADPKAVLTAPIDVPQNSALYGALAGTRVSIPYYVAYPTTADNPRGSYLFPLQAAYEPTFVHVERAGDAPLPSRARSRFPVIVSSHGYATHPAWDINRSKMLASHGFFVVMPLYGDGRFAPLGANDLPLRALRAFATKVLLDQLLNESTYRGFLDPDRVGVTGLSLGGVTALTLLGARLDLSRENLSDTRIRAGIGIVPYLGSSKGGSEFYPFGPNNVGMSEISKPFLCIYGSSDSVAPASFILPAMSRLSGPRYVVEFVNQPHVFTGPFWSDRENWEVLFFRAYLQDDAEALALLGSVDGIAGFGEDRQHFELQRTTAE